MFPTTVVVGLCTLLVVFNPCQCYEHYRDRIPNGQNVKSPCKPDEDWIGVGHTLSGGSGARNPFGQDFAKYGHQWTRELCMLDSDGDGMKNGEELNDVNCTWSSGDPSPEGDVTHPGICDPWNDPKCLAKDQSWVLNSCEPSKFECDGLNETHVQNMTLKFPRTAIPANPTVYYCQIFEMPRDQDYHGIATTPIVDNKILLHHMVLFGCVGEVKVQPEPQPCGMVASQNCSSIVSLWGVGHAGDCGHKQAGFRIGKTGYKHLALQLHWNNPEKKSGLFDQSGMTVYYTPELRENDAGVFTVGQSDFLVPHRTPLTTTEATCPGDCTQDMFMGNIHVTAVFNHMHYLGKSQYFELHRNGQKVKDIAVDRHYNYDNPHVHSFSDPLELRPGDALKTRCEFDSSNVDVTTRYGWGTNDEMCFTFITYYPKQNINSTTCLSAGPFPYCDIAKNPVVDGCNTQSLQSDFILLYVDIDSNCPVFGDCTKPCYDAVQRAKQHKCFQGEVYQRLVVPAILRSSFGMRGLKKLRICDCGLSEVTVSDTYISNPAKPEGSTCDWHRLFETTHNHDLSQIFTNVTTKCSPSGYCFHQCLSAVTAARAHPCFQAAEWSYGRWYLQSKDTMSIWHFFLGFESCNCELGPVTAGPKSEAPERRLSFLSATILFTVMLLHRCLLRM